MHVPGFLFIDHVAISVPLGKLDEQVQKYEQMGFRVLHREEVYGTDQVREVLLEVPEGPNLIQLLEPMTPDSPVAKQIEKAGGRGGLAHVAWRVSDIQTAFDHLKSLGLPLLDAAPRKGSRGTTIFFIHPKALGHLVEVVATSA